MPITTDLSTTTGQIRMLIGDNVEGKGVKPDGSNFSDEEIAFFYAREGRINTAAALACETLSYLWNLHPDFEADGLKVARGKISAGWWRAAVRFRSSIGARVVSMIRQDAYSDAIPAAASDGVQNGDELP